MKCSCNKKIETNLKCSKCGQPICPKCLIQTPVGARCPKCAKLYQLPTFKVSVKQTFLAIGSGLAIAVLAGIMWGLANSYIDTIYVNLLIAVIIGYTIGEAVSASSNSKRANRLAVIAGLSMVASYIISTLPPWGDFFDSADILTVVLDLISVTVGAYIAVTRLR